MADWTQAPDRMALGKMDTGELLTVQFNPERVREALEPLYNRLQIVGMSHELLQYGSTKNFVVEFDLNFDALVGKSAYNIEAARKFILGMGYSRRNAAAAQLSNGQPTTVAVIWPNLYTLTTKMTSYSGDLKTFAKSGRLLRWSAHLKFEEVRDMRLWADDVEVQGTIRAASSGPDPNNTAANGG
jgi:Contractile injection system tube protein